MGTTSLSTAMVRTIKRGSTIGYYRSVTNRISSFTIEKILFWVDTWYRTALCLRGCDQLCISFKVKMRLVIWAAASGMSSFAQYSVYRNNLILFNRYTGKMAISKVDISDVYAILIKNIVVFYKYGTSKCFTGRVSDAHYHTSSACLYRSIGCFPVILFAYQIRSIMKAIFIAAALRGDNIALIVVRNTGVHIWTDKLLRSTGSFAAGSTAGRAFGYNRGASRRGSLRFAAGRHYTGKPIS